MRLIVTGKVNDEFNEIKKVLQIADRCEGRNELIKLRIIGVGFQLDS